MSFQVVKQESKTLLKGQKILDYFGSTIQNQKNNDGVIRINSEGEPAGFFGIGSLPENIKGAKRSAFMDWLLSNKKMRKNMAIRLLYGTGAYMDASVLEKQLKADGYRGLLPEEIPTTDDYNRMYDLHEILNQLV